MDGQNWRRFTRYCTQANLRKGGQTLFKLILICMKVSFIMLRYLLCLFCVVVILHIKLGFTLKFRNRNEPT